MPHPSWNESYASGQLPWDTGQPEPLLVEFVTSGAVTPGPTLEIGAGTGTNAIWMAERGFDLLGVDVSPLAVERAQAKMAGRTLRCRFSAWDFLAAPPSGGPFKFVFDRGCFHVFDEPGERDRFAAQVAAVLAPGESFHTWDPGKMGTVPFEIRRRCKAAVTTPKLGSACRVIAPVRVSNEK